MRGYTQGVRVEGLRVNSGLAVRGRGFGRLGFGVGGNLIRPAAEICLPGPAPTQVP